MNKAKVKKNISNLKKIKEIIEISKFDTLQKLQNATKISDTYLEMALSAKDLIDFANEKYNIKEKKIKSKTGKSLWVYVTPDEELMSISNSKFERMIKEGFDAERDSIIALGDKAVKFAHKHMINIEYEAVTSSGLEDLVATSIASSIASGEVAKVNFVINSPKLIDSPITVYPMSELNVSHKYDGIHVDKKYSFYPSITQSLESLSRIYIFRITNALIKETQYFHLKEKLIRHEGSIKNVDDKIEEKTREMNKINRKNETEELILVSQIAKRGGSDE